MARSNYVDKSTAAVRDCTAETSVDEIFRSVRLLADVDQLIELRLLHAIVKGRAGLHTMSGYFSDYKALAIAAFEHRKTVQGAYITLNPANPALLARAVNHV